MWIQWYEDDRPLSIPKRYLRMTSEQRQARIRKIEEKMKRKQAKTKKPMNCFVP